MTTATDDLRTIAATVAERVDRAQPRSRGDLELTIRVLEDLADDLDGYPIGTTRDRLGAAEDEPTVVLLRRVSNGHHRLGVAARRHELRDAAVARIAGLREVLTDATDETVAPDRLAELVPACC